ncbi:hypothetical protein LJC40_05145 [Synergistaceae bacterium OttesenSCG-928-D05]|nr:hypothetical protein [Synergistaceae bacterium OttesenSCG-928-D05]
MRARKFLPGLLLLFMLLAALLAANPAIAAIDVTNMADDVAYEVAAASGDVTFTGNYDKETERIADMIGTVGDSAELTFENLSVALKKDEFTYHGSILLASAAKTQLTLSGNNTLSYNTGAPIVARVENALTITGKGRLTVSALNASTALPAGVPAIGSDGHASTGSIFIEGGYITALGYNAPAIGDAATSEEPKREIKITGGVVYAKSNSASFPGIALGNVDNQSPVFIMGGSVSADVQMPKNQFGDDLQVYARNFGAKHVGKSVSFSVEGQERYTYVFDVPDDGIAWIWAPSTAVVPEVAEVTLTGSGSTGVNVLTVTATGAPTGYLWAYAPTLADAQAQRFTTLTTTREPTYTDLECQLAEQRFYTATALYDDGWFLFQFAFGHTSPDSRGS